MKLHTLRRSTGLAAVAVTLSLGLAACGDDGGDSASDSSAASDSPAEESSPTEEPSAEESDIASQVFGPGCAAVPTDASNPGSFEGMVQDPVATAASNNELLSTLVAAVGAAGLGETLNGLEAATVFAPTNDAFAKIPADALNEVLADKKTLTAILTHHVIGEQLAPEALAGEHETLNGDMLTVEGSGENFTVAGDNAKVVCGNVPTANATVYVIDTVLMPA